MHEVLLGNCFNNVNDFHILLYMYNNHFQLYIVLPLDKNNKVIL